MCSLFCYCGVEKRSITSYFCHTILMALDKPQHVAVACIDLSSDILDLYNLLHSARLMIMNHDI